MCEKPYLKLQCSLGEGPFYEEDTGVLRFVDIVKKEIHTVNVQKGPKSHKVVQLDDSVGSVSIIDSQFGEYIVGAKYGFAIFNKEKSSLRYIKKIYEDDEIMAEKMRFNDGAVDSRGRFWAGTMNDWVSRPDTDDQLIGCVFRLDPDMTLHRMIENVSIPNGMGWSPDDKVMYFTDSPSKAIFAYDFDVEAGSVSNKRVFFQLGDDEGGVLDGCTIDQGGCLWVAHHEGSRVIQISPQGKVISQINIPAWKATCPAFGGLGFNELFITTAGVEDDDEGKPVGSTDNGSLFRIQTAAKGLRSNQFVMEGL
ncbi:hypothetical protein EDC01DRAFT_611716 [Geopyxis carbonaria]|nr:hypothetical protein EDC01DRAFT_611716 [Geopyxis carbonaria]